MDFVESELIALRKAFGKLERYVLANEFKGYDPYDVLAGKFPFHKLGKWPPILAIQVFKRNPLNFRKLFGVPRMWNPKGLGLFLKGYAALPANEENKTRCEWLFEKIMALQTPNIPGLAWGYPFPWASPEKFLPQWSPTSVVSGFVVQGLDAYYRKYGDKRALEAMDQVCVFISEALFHTQTDDGEYAISYSIAAPDFCYNASLLAAQVYALTYAHTRNQTYYDTARRATDAVLKYQKPNGSWNYSKNLKTGKERVQVDFHQGFVIDSLLAISEALDYKTRAMENAIQKGFEFYANNHFLDSGQAKWRLPAQFPADIHHQSQGILTAVRYSKTYPNERATLLAKRVLEYTLRHFQAERGYFYYRKHKFFTDKTSYMRWGNAWMFLALAKLIETAEGAAQDFKNKTRNQTAAL